MSYVERHLLEKEVVLFKTGKHWVVFSPVPVWIFLAFMVHHFAILKYFALAPLTLALCFFFLGIIDLCFSEYAITNQRIFMKEGLVWRTSVETLLSSVAKSELQQSVAGYLLGYGQLIIFGFGGSNRFSNIRRPAEFQRYLSVQLEKY